MKKRICLLLALSMLFTFCSCSGLMKDKTDTEDPPATEGTEAPTEVVYEISEADADGLNDYQELKQLGTDPLTTTMTQTACATVMNWKTG